MALNLTAPPGFEGFDEQRPVRVYRRNLPHWRQDGVTYFVTMQLADALPAAKRNELDAMRREWELRNPPPRDESACVDYARIIFRAVEDSIDFGYGRCWFRDPLHADELNRSILHFHEQRYSIGCFVIMANHCHLVIRPFAGFELEQQVGGIKNVVANTVSRVEGLQGPFWHQESFDRIIRDEDHLYRVVQYIGRNPAKAGVPRDNWRRWINPNWQAAGWDFVDF